MTRRELWDTICSAAAELYDGREARAFTAAVCEDRFGLRFTDVIVEPEAPYPDRDDLPEVVGEIRRGRPAQYITGYALFCGRKFAVREGVLIPRPETEELVLRIAEEQKTRGKANLLDIGTGSGCIAVSLAALLPEARVTAVDISDTALETAGENARRNRVTVELQKCDILKETPQGRFDIIVSNPPYITRSEKSQMKRNVLDYEPEEALFVEDSDPLLFYRTIARRGREMLRPGGTLYFEINEQFGPQTRTMLEETGYTDVRLHDDLFGKPRTITAWLK